MFDIPKPFPVPADKIEQILFLMKTLIGRYEAGKQHRRGYKAGEDISRKG